MRSEKDAMNDFKVVCDTVYAELLNKDYASMVALTDTLKTIKNINYSENYVLENLNKCLELAYQSRLYHIANKNYDVLPILNSMIVVFEEKEKDASYFKS